MTIPYADDAQFVADLETLANAFRSDAPISDPEKEAAGRVALRLLCDVGTIADSLRRIATAQEKIARGGVDPGHSGY